MRLCIRLQKEAVRLLLYQPGISCREVARTIGTSTGPVIKLQNRLNASGLDWNALKELDDDQWQAALKTKNRSIAQRKEHPDWKGVDEQMHLPDATLAVIWNEWREGHPNGIGYSAFTELYREWSSHQSIAMRRTHVPGDVLFTDFAGRTVEIKSRSGGPSSFAQVFVAVLGYSNKIFIHAVPTQRIDDWIACHVACFEFFGGCPKWVVMDNLKSAVLKNTRDGILMNASYQELLQHYDIAARPTRPRKPKDKAKAEVSVQIAQRLALFAIRNLTFFSVDELNVELRRRMDAINERPFRRLPGCRNSAFEEERTSLKPLPQEPYRFATWRYDVLVAKDYHVLHEDCQYSVPYQHRNQRVSLRTSQNLVEIFHRSKRLTVHERLKGAGLVSTHDEHRPVSHQRVLEGEPKALMDWAATAGPMTLQMITHHLTERSDGPNGLKAANNIRQLARLHGEARIEQICGYALPLRITALRDLKSILSSGIDQRPKSPTSNVVAMADVRGSSYFRKDAS